MTIRRKFSLWIAAILLVASVVSASFHFRLEQIQKEERFRSVGETISAVVEEILASHMLTRDTKVVNEILGGLEAIDPLHRVLIINRAGIVKGTTDKALLETKTPFLLDDLTVAGKNGVFLEDEPLFRWHHPIRNRPECIGCHPDEGAYNGLIVADFSLQGYERHTSRHLGAGFSVIFASSIFAGILLYAFAGTLVTKRLSRVVEGVTAFREGNYEGPVVVEGEDEISDLARNFNEMAAVIDEREREKDDLVSLLERSKMEWVETFDSIADLIFIHDRESKIIKANRAFAAYMGLHPRELVGTACVDLFGTMKAPIFCCTHMAGVLEGQGAVSEEVHDPRTNKIYRVAVFPYFSPRQEVVGAIHVARDVTDERENEMRLVMSERLATLGQMAAGIAHEINNPLASIAGCAEGLLSRVRKERYDPGLFESYLTIIDEEITRCTSITTNMLSLVRGGASAAEPVRMDEALDKTVELIGFQGRLKNVEIVRNYPSEALPGVRGNEGEIRQALMAILSNALDAMNQEARLTLVVAAREGKVTVDVRDSGPGIPAGDHERIFDPFFTTKQGEGGTGLGLAIAKKIVVNHGGTISMTSVEGGGTTFSISLPALQEPSA